MGLSMIYGLPGRGKSHFGLFYGLLIAHKYQKRLVTNFLLNLDRVAHYCNWMGYYWLLDRIDKGYIIYISLDSNAAELLSLKNSVIVADEAALYFPARAYRDTSKKLLADIVQVRHDASYLLCIAQSEIQVDKQIRGLAYEIFHCNGISVFDKKLRSERLVYKSTLRFDPDRYQQYLSDPKVRKNPLKSKLVANKKWAGFLTSADKYLFECFDSFARLDSLDEEYDSDYERVISLTASDNLKFSETDEFYLVSSGKLPNLPKLNKAALYFFKKTGLMNIAVKLSKLRLSKVEKLVLKRVYLLFASIHIVGGLLCLLLQGLVSMQWLLSSVLFWFLRWFYLHLI